MALPTQEIVEVMRQSSRKSAGMRKVRPGPKCGIACATYGGAHLGPREAEANLTLLEIEIEHLGFKSIGTFSCPGKMVDYATPEWYHGDIRDRPNDADLQRAAQFVKDTLRSDSVLAYLESATYIGRIYLPECAIVSMATVMARISASFWPGSMATP